MSERRSLPARRLAGFYLSRAGQEKRYDIERTSWHAEIDPARGLLAHVDLRVSIPSRNRRVVELPVACRAFDPSHPDHLVAGAPIKMPEGRADFIDEVLQMPAVLAPLSPLSRMPPSASGETHKLTLIPRGDGHWRMRWEGLLTLECHGEEFVPVGFTIVDRVVPFGGLACRDVGLGRKLIPDFSEWRAADHWPHRLFRR